jgi:rhamnose transport system substrate-binding protein
MKQRLNMKKVVLGLLIVMIIGASPVFAGGRQEGDGVIKVTYIPITSGIPYFDPIIQGMKDAVEKRGGEFSMIAPNEVSPTSQIPLIKTQIQRDVDVICISPNSVDAMNEVLAEAREKGIKVLTVNDDILGHEEYRDGSILSADYNRLAEDSFKVFAEKMGHKGTFVVLSSTTDAPFQNNQIAIYKSIMSRDAKYAEMEMVEVLYGNDEPLKSLTEAEAALQKYPDLDGIMSPTTVGVIAAAQAVENADKQDQITVYGLGTPNQCRNYIKSGVLAGAMLWDTYRTGYVAGDIAIQLAKGVLVLSKGSEVAVDAYSSVKVLANNVMYAGPPLDLGVENIDKHDF